ncbi:hypothetical protein AAW14_27635 [Streptomyces hygroscopicus]|uniref:DUF5988 family protein n=1 Tax=Streptomyces hygroscopicus TaxID=1912 RepID=UPI00223FD769|nr:DUF5988 family protein [Streptomyces hygroscopicus]MCW7945669.1 hypothetical protein [Streptomyces hygroscopicus]
MSITPNAILRGGAGVPDQERVRYVANIADTFKLHLANRYEHYEPTDAKHTRHDGLELRVFEWVCRTYVAE